MFHCFDLGGLVTQDGRTIAPRRLLRAGSLYRIGSRAVRSLRAQGLGCVLDLRTVAESAQRPDKVLSGVRYAQIPLFEERVVGITREKTHNYVAMLRSMTDIADLYVAMVTDDYCVQHLGEVLRFIVRHAIEGEGAILYHCTAGKDRTGLVTALLLTVLGVDLDRILANYMAINRVQRGTANGCYALALLLTFDRQLAFKGKDYFTAKPHYLMRAFAAIEANYGSVDDFISHTLGVDAATQQAFRDALLL